MKEGFLEAKFLKGILADAEDCARPVLLGILSSSCSPARRESESERETKRKGEDSRSTNSSLAEMAYLVEFDRRGLALQQWRLHVGSFYSIGRSTACSIVLPHISVSRLHAQLQLKEFPAEEVAVELRELGAVNGTYVNGRRLENREVCRLDSQSEILFGEARTAYRFMKGGMKRDACAYFFSF